MLVPSWMVVPILASLTPSLYLDFLPAFTRGKFCSRKVFKSSPIMPANTDTHTHTHTHREREREREREKEKEQCVVGWTQEQE